MRFDFGTVVAVPFPFTDRDTSIRRPAVILSGHANFNAAAGHAVMAMITRQGNKARWPLDCPITDLDAAGLPAPSLIRFKLFTLDQRLVIKALGELSAADKKQLKKNLNALLRAGD